MAARFGISRHALRTSASEKTSGRRKKHPAAHPAKNSNRYSKSALLLLENKNSMHRCPYRQKLMTDAKANSAMAIDSIFPPVSPITSTNACCAAAPQGTTPLAKIASAVTVQTKMVSQKTSSIPQNPCSTGLVAPLHACAIEALPSPASWVKIPRAIPTRIEVNSPTLVPATPATGEANASVKISLIACGRFCRK